VLCYRNRTRRWSPRIKSALPSLPVPPRNSQAARLPQRRGPLPIGGALERLLLQELGEGQATEVSLQQPMKLLSPGSASNGEMGSRVATR